MSQSFDWSNLFRASSTPLAVLGPDGAITDLNAGWQRLLTDPSRARGQLFHSIVHATDTERVGRALTELGPGSTVFDVRFRPELSSAVGVERFEASRIDSGNVLLVGLGRGEASAKVANDAAREEHALARAQQEETLRVFTRALDGGPLILWATDRNGICTLSEGQGLGRLGLKPGALVGLSLFEVYKGSPLVVETIRRALAGEDSQSMTVNIGSLHFENFYLSLRSATGEIDGCIGLTIDITDRAKVEHELREKLTLIERQSATIRSLATPIIRVWDDVVCVPVIGTVDSARTADLMENLLTTIVRDRTRYAVIDLTGVEIVDTQTADHLIQIFRAAKVLGVEGVLCGIRPAVAQTIISIGVDLGAVRTMRTLRDALRWCINEMHDDVVEVAPNRVPAERRRRGAQK